MEEIKRFVMHKSEVNGFDFYKYLHIKGGSGNWQSKRADCRNGGEFDFILFYALPEIMEKKPIGMCERIWCREAKITYGEGKDINEAHKDYLSKVSKLKTGSADR